MLSSVFPQFENLKSIERTRFFGDGLINQTWKIDTPSGSFILQRINQNVFKNPGFIAENIEMLGDFLRANFPSYLFIKPIPTIDGKLLFQDSEHGCFRLFPFVEGSCTIATVNNPFQASEAASQFGKFTRLLHKFEPDRLHITLPDFHNLSLRYQEMINTIDLAPESRISPARQSINYLLKQKSIADTYDNIVHNPSFKIRIMHHDTKVSNVLFDQSGKGLCVIDLDTVMPGYFISDLGDMMRTYLSPANEEEKDFNKITVRDDYFMAIVKGYLSEMGEVLSQEEIKHFVYAGKFMIYMQALRFLTDYLNHDIYYGQQYEGHNLIRAENQITLLQRLIEKENKFQEMVYSAL